MKNILIALVVLLLSSCSKQQVVVPHDVDIPVIVPCHIDLPAAPSWNSYSAAKASFPVQVAAIIADLNLSKGYISQLQSAIAACNDNSNHS